MNPIDAAADRLATGTSDNLARDAAIVAIGALIFGAAVLAPCTLLYLLAV